MPNSPQANRKYPSVSVVVPKMEFPPKEAQPTVPTTTTNPIKTESTSSNMANANPPMTASAQSTPDGQVSESEMQLVSSLAKLQKLEAMIHQLRTLLPGRLLDPLFHTLNSKAGPVSPELLSKQMSRAASSGVAEVTEFQSLWHSPEMKAVWAHIDAQIKENGGQLLQPTGVWDRDYAVLEEELLKDETARKDQHRRADEEVERSKIQATEGGWGAIIDGFVRRDVPGVRVSPSKNVSGATVVLPKAGMAFLVHTVPGTEINGVPEWQVSTRSVLGQPKSRLEGAVADCLNSRPRPWDLALLLDMIASYTDVKLTPCVKCAKMTDPATQLPTVRRQKSSHPSDTVWEAYHPSCV
ncbi:mediator complex subunit 27-domain-containing protein [Aspergillus avenaceus]|uniref:Mediator complex subunit 27-domain-containing protein n=1 Tax=Aspergillus avenaceus TaxID=36643 RepID=A0A5N6U0N4_ASPAV|nr:mediator complex subunit 27-domain-containing protein [Aspergillus avenaceus]